MLLPLIQIDGYEIVGHLRFCISCRKWKNVSVFRVRRSKRHYRSDICSRCEKPFRIENPTSVARRLVITAEGRQFLDQLREEESLVGSNH